MEKNEYSVTLVKATLADGSPIMKDHVYRFAMPDFFFNGGDDFQRVREWYHKPAVSIGSDIRDQMTRYCESQTHINSMDKPLYDENYPLFKVIKTNQKFLS